MLVLLAACTLAAASDGYASWSERAGKMSTTEISTEEATRGAEKRVEEHRNKLALRRIRPVQPGPDWDADPTAIPYMHYQLNKRTGLPVRINNDGLDLTKPELFEEQVVYLTAHNTWALTDAEVKNLALFLQRGGSLFLDDCLAGGGPFWKCIPTEMGKVLPGVAPVPITDRYDPLVESASKLIYDWRCGGFLYYVVDERPAVFCGPYDDGCGWEISSPPTASNPLGEGVGHGGSDILREGFYTRACNLMVFFYTH
jgi:hypothetical protein